MTDRRLRATISGSTLDHAREFNEIELASVEALAGGPYSENRVSR
jgi:hypothetical protein